MEHHRVVDASAIETKIREHFTRTGSNEQHRPVEQIVAKILPVVCSRNVADVAFALSPQQAYVMQGTLTLAQALVDLVEDAAPEPAPAHPLAPDLDTALSEALKQSGCSSYATAVQYLTNYFVTVFERSRKVSISELAKWLDSVSIPLAPAHPDVPASILWSRVFDLAFGKGAGCPPSQEPVEAFLIRVVEQWKSQAELWRLLAVRLRRESDKDAQDAIVELMGAGAAVKEVYPKVVLTRPFVLERLNKLSELMRFTDDLMRIAPTLNVAPNLEAVEAEIERLKTMSEAWGNLATALDCDVDPKEILRNVREDLAEIKFLDEVMKKFKAGNLVELGAKLQGTIELVERLGGWGNANNRLDYLDKEAERVVNLCTIGENLERDRDEWRKIAQTLAERPVTVNVA